MKEYKCTQCEEGIMKLIYMIASNPPKKQWECNKCNHIHIGEEKEMPKSKNIYQELYDNCKEVELGFNKIFYEQQIADIIQKQIIDALRVIIFASSLLLMNKDITVK